MRLPVCCRDYEGRITGQWKKILREALRQYFKYFKIWFIIAGILAVITIGAAVVHALTPKPVRGNGQEPTERVYDYADMLTDEEEQSLREYIAECEEDSGRYRHRNNLRIGRI